MLTDEIPPYVHVDVYSHGFRVYKFNEHVRVTCRSYYKNFGYEEKTFAKRGRKIISEVKYTYAVMSAKCDEYFFHRSQLEEFLEFLRINHIRPERIKRRDIPMYEPKLVDFKWYNPAVQPYDYQHPIISFFAQLLPRAKLLGMQMGGGKTLTTIFSIRDTGARTVLIMRPSFIDQWVSVFVKSFQLEKGEIYVVGGNGSIKAMQELINLALHSEDFAERAKIIIISNAAYRAFIRSYLDYGIEEHQKLGWSIAPYEFFPPLRAHTRVIDERHLDFHFNWVVDCFTHVYRSICLT